MFNSLHYKRAEDIKTENEKEEKALSRRKARRDELAAKARERSADPSDINGNDLAYTRSLGRGASEEAQKKAAPWVAPADYQFRERHKEKEVSQKPFLTTKWKYKHEKQRAEDTAADNKLRTSYHLEPLYADPGPNKRMEKFSHNPMTYNLRPRERAKETSPDVPWRTSGFTTTKERINFQLDKFAPRTLGEPLPSRLPQPDDKHKRLAGNFNLALPKGKMFDNDWMHYVDDAPFVDRKHVSTAGAAGVQSAIGMRTRQIEKEIKVKDPVKARVGFNAAVHPEPLFGKFEYAPL